MTHAAEEEFWTLSAVNAPVPPETGTEPHASSVQTPKFGVPQS